MLISRLEILVQLLNKFYLVCLMNVDVGKNEDREQKLFTFIISARVPSYAMWYSKSVKPVSAKIWAKSGSGGAFRT